MCCGVIYESYLPANHSLQTCPGRKVQCQYRTVGVQDCITDTVNNVQWTFICILACSNYELGLGGGYDSTPRIPPKPWQFLPDLGVLHEGVDIQRGSHIMRSCQEQGIIVFTRYS